MSSLAERIQLILDTHGWSQRELSRRIGLAGPQVGMMLKRLKTKPDADIAAKTLGKIAEVANVSLVWLASGEGPMEEATERTIVYDDPVPERGEALAFILKSNPKFSPKATRLVQGATYDRPAHLPRMTSLEWVEEFQRVARSLETGVLYTFTTPVVVPPDEPEKPELAGLSDKEKLRRELQAVADKHRAREAETGEKGWTMDDVEPPPEPDEPKPRKKLNPRRGQE